MRVVNWAHGALLMMAMYLTYYLVTLAGIDVYLCCIITGAVMFGVGYFLQKALFYKLIVREKEREPVNVLLFTSWTWYGADFSGADPLRRLRASSADRLYR